MSRWKIDYRILSSRPSRCESKDICKYTRTIGFLFINRTNIRANNKENGFFLSALSFRPRHMIDPTRISLFTQHCVVVTESITEISLDRNLLFETGTTSESRMWARKVSSRSFDRCSVLYIDVLWRRTYNHGGLVKQNNIF